jgi:hypothetical protein
MYLFHLMFAECWSSDTVVHLAQCTCATISTLSSGGTEDSEDCGVPSASLDAVGDADVEVRQAGVYHRVATWFPTLGRFICERNLISTAMIQAYLQTDGRRHCMCMALKTFMLLRPNLTTALPYMCAPSLLSAHMLKRSGL